MSARAIMCTGLMLVGCFPELDDRPWLIETPRLIAIRSEPAEAAPGDQVRFLALSAAPMGQEAPATPQIQWSFCQQPRTLAERNAVAPECARDEEVLVALPQGEGMIPRDACARFGSTPPPSAPDQPPFRPTDPDESGGYYQPVRAELLDRDALSFGFVRLNCSLDAAPLPIARGFAQGYRRNEHPQIQEVSVGREDGAEPLDAVGAVSGGATLSLQLRARAGAERYLYYDRAEVQLNDRTEVLTVQWYVDAGALIELGQEASWTLPAEPGPARLWVVLRDDRGGADWQTYSVMIQ